MNNKYNKVPDIITGKDLDYLSDMFNWNYNAYKKSSDCIGKIQDMEMKEIMIKASNIFHNNLNTLLNILKRGGQSE